jgi:hypothetical protein
MELLFCKNDEFVSKAESPLCYLTWWSKRIINSGHNSDDIKLSEHPSGQLRLKCRGA